MCARPLSISLSLSVCCSLALSFFLSLGPPKRLAHPASTLAQAAVCLLRYQFFDASAEGVGDAARA